jgi:hypothetical protein
MKRTITVAATLILLGGMAQAGQVQELPLPPSIVPNHLENFIATQKPRIGYSQRNDSDAI